MGAVPILTNIGTINTFRGLPNEDIKEWLTQFNWIADVNQWPEDIRCVLLPGYLEGVAKTWYSTVPLADRGNTEAIITILSTSGLICSIPQSIVIKTSIR